MKSHQYNKLAAYQAVLNLLTSTHEAEAIVAFPQAFARFRAKLEDLTALRARQTQKLSPALVQRDAILGAALREALRIAGIVRSYAHAHDDPVLADRVRLTPRQLRETRIARRLALAQRVHDATLPVLDALAGYGVTAATLAALQEKIADAELAVRGPRDVMVVRVAATQQLVVALREIDAVLKNQLDPLLFPLQETQPEFHARYRFCRDIINTGRGRGAVAAAPDAMIEATPLAPLRLPTADASTAAA